MSLPRSSSSSGYESHPSSPPRNRADAPHIRRPYAHQEPMRSDSWRPEPGRYDDANRSSAQHQPYPRPSSNSYRHKTGQRSESNELHLRRSLVVEPGRTAVHRSPPREPRRMRMYTDMYRPRYSSDEHSIVLSKSQKKRARRAKRHGDSWTPQADRDQPTERGREHLERGRNTGSRDTFRQV